MNTPIATFKGETFFPRDLLIFVNRVKEDFDLPLHNHDFLEITYVAEGVGFHHIGGQVHKVRKGDLNIIPVGVPHVFRPAAPDPAKHPLAVYNCVVSPRLLEQLDSLITDRDIAAFMQNLHLGEARHYASSEAEEMLDRLFLTLHHEFALPRTGSADLLHALLLQLLITIYRCTEDGKVGGKGASAGADVPILSSNENAPLPPHTGKESFFRLLAELDRFYHEDVTLAYLARTSGYSERHLQRLFQRHTGQSFRRYRQSRRIEHSCELLKRSGLKIEDIADKVGYKDADAFASVFKRYTGLAPNDYRKQFKT